MRCTGLLPEWIDHHYFVTGSRRTTYSVLGCGGPAEVGAHVYWIPSSGAYDGAHYIIPMCHGCEPLAGYGELALRLAVAEAHHAVGDTAAATTALVVALERLWIRGHGIPEGLPRERYLTQVPVNARLIALGRAWLGDAAVMPPSPGLAQGG